MNPMGKLFHNPTATRTCRRSEVQFNLNYINLMKTKSVYVNIKMMNHITQI